MKLVRLPARMLTVMSLGMTAHALLALDVKIGFNGDL
ncbi:hypothetical protein SAMN05192544_103030 [Paraburkholderia hospita]|nr:hypothetical protein SAMN05192544_103030 [Paraburkholderia hospita]